MAGTARDRALGLLAVRWRSREELRQRLARAGFDTDEIRDTLDDLERAGLIEDGRFARELVRAHAGRRLSGDRAIVSALRRKGIASDVADAALGEAGDEAARARELADRGAVRMGGLQPEVAFRRLFGMLVRRGYGPQLARETCRAALSEIFGADGLLEPRGRPGRGIATRRRSP